MSGADGSEQVEKVRKVFDDWARRGKAEGMEESHGRAARAGFDLLELRKDATYLDIGCGNGYTVRWAAAACPDGSAVGLDVAPEMIERARAMSAEHGNAQFVVGRFPGTALPLERFDAIFSMEALYYLPDLDAALARIAELLSPGGRFACVVDFYEENEESHDWPEMMGMPLTLLSEAGWRERMEAAGLAVTRQERARDEDPTGEDPWKTREGSLVTLAEKPR